MKRTLFFLGLFLTALIAFSVYSYALVDPNLVLSQNDSFWRFQQFMWQIGYHQPDLRTLLYVMIVCCLVVTWRFVSNAQARVKRFGLGACILILFFAHPALSHDVFNYMFNARMIIEYGLDPHVNTALQASSDPWVRFMHNVHTPAPYGYGWTYLSLLPYLLGMEKLILTLGAFKLWMILGWGLWLCAISKLQQYLRQAGEHMQNGWWVLAFHPLILLEHVGVMHNDLWMMGAVIASFWVLFREKMARLRRLSMFLVSAGLLGVAVWMKFVPLVLFPIWILLWGLVWKPTWKQGVIGWISDHWADLCAVACFIPLLLSRSQQFHPWYLAWSLSFYPFCRVRWTRLALLSFSISSLYRYVPFLLEGEYTSEVLATQRWITWFGGIALFGLLAVTSRVLAMHRARMKQ